jgi:hypothetical protein
MTSPLSTEGWSLVDSATAFCKAAFRSQFANICACPFICECFTMGLALDTQSFIDGCPRKVDAAVVSISYCSVLQINF